MTLSLLALIVLASLILGYGVYGRLVARAFRLDDARETPAERMRDGADFVPARPFYLMGQHFSAIAAAGPIAGPILACTAFGWAPSLAWIVLGGVLIGAVHDFSSLFASVRHQARSVAEIVKENIGVRAWLAMLAFIWIALVYVIVAFTDITAATFVGATEELAGLSAPFNKGGAVAAASTMYLLLALLMGLVQRRWRLPLWAVTLVFVPASLGVVWLGTRVSTVLVLPHLSWCVVILVYCAVASLLPVWLLLQPRGYLGGFILYLALAVGLLGILFGGFEIRQPAFTAAPLFGLKGSLFPFLFVTIACGACSGFHGLVCSGTTSKQIARESHCRPVGYGGMLLESFVALIALATVLIVAPGGLGGRAPGTLYGDGLAAFLTSVIPVGVAAAATFGAMAFSTFVFDTLDVATRLGRYILQELTGVQGRAAAGLATAATAGVPLAILLASGEGAYRTFWLLFGTSNQLLAALTLIGITVWLRRTGRPFWFTLLPACFVAGITLWSLLGQGLGFAAGMRDAGTGALNLAALANLVVAVLLALLAGYLILAAPRAARGAAAGR